MPTPKETLDDLVARSRDSNATLTDLKVPTEFYEELAREVAPKTPSEHYGFTITVDPDLDEEPGLDFESKTVH